MKLLHQEFLRHLVETENSDPCPGAQRLVPLQGLCQGEVYLPLAVPSHGLALPRGVMGHWTLTGEEAATEPLLSKAAWVGPAVPSLPASTRRSKCHLSPSGTVSLAQLQDSEDQLGLCTDPPTAGS